MPTSSASRSATDARVAGVERSERILVTGAGGFVGTWLTRRLAERLGPSDGLFPILREGGSRRTDIKDAAEVDGLVRDVRPTCVVHLAAMSSPIEARQNSRLAWDTNLYGTMNLAEAVMRHAPEARFLFAGSSEIYGGSFNRTGGVADETTLPDPRNPYAATKAAADLMLGQMAEFGLRAVRFRPFNHTGPGQSTDFVIPAFAAQIASIERRERAAVLKVGNLDARRDFLDVRDVVEAYIAAILSPALPPGTVLNLASGVPRRVGDVLDGLLAMSDVAIRIERDEALIRPSDLPIAAGNAERARELLRWQPVVPWETTLRDVLDDYRSRRAG